MTGTALAKIEIMESQVKALQNSAEPLNAIKEATVDECSKPATMEEEVQKGLVEAKKAIDGAKQYIKEQREKIVKAIAGPLAEAKKELGLMDAKCATAEKSCKATIE